MRSCARLYDRTALALLSHGYLPYSVASDSKLLETSRGLGTGGPAPRRAIAAPAARERGRKVSNVMRWTRNCAKSLENLVLDAFWV